MFNRYPISPPVTVIINTILFIILSKQIMYASGNNTPLKTEPPTTAPPHLIELLN